MKSGIYKILNTFNGKFYIGSAVNIEHRWQTHLWRFNKGSHHNKHMQSAWNFYGGEIFIFEILEYCEIEKRIEREQWWIDQTDAVAKGYNKRKIAESNAGVKRSEDAKLKQKLAMTGFKHDPWAIAKMCHYQSNKTEEHKRNISLGKMGHEVSEKTKKKIGDGNRGRIQTEEELTKRRLYKPTEKTKIRISLTFKIKRVIKEYVKNIPHAEIVALYE